MNLVQIDKTKCIACGLCTHSCPYQSLQQKEKGQSPVFVEENGCIRCGHCVAICPKSAITHNDMDMHQFVSISNKINADDMEMFLKSKRSVRNFSDKPVDKPIIERLINVACQAPTDANTQEKGFIVINQKKQISKIESLIVEGFKQFIKKGEENGILKTTKEMKRSRAIVNYHENGGHPIFRAAPCLIVIYGPEKNTFSWYNCALASDYLMLQAHSLGIESCIIGVSLYEPKQLGQLLAIPNGQQIYSILTLGYPKYKYQRTVSRQKPTILWR